MTGFPADLIKLVDTALENCFTAERLDAEIVTAVSAISPVEIATLVDLCVERSAVVIQRGGFKRDPLTRMQAKHYLDDLFPLGSQDDEDAC